MKKLVYLITAIFTFLVVNIDILAKENIYYTNSQNVNFTKEEYQYLIKNVSEKFVKSASQKFVDIALKNPNLIEEIVISESPNYNYTKKLSNVEEPSKNELYIISTPDIPEIAIDYSVDWNKNLPTMKSFDVIGLRWTNTNFKIDEKKFNTYQLTDTGFVNYSYNGGNTKHASNGIGTSMNLINNSKERIRMNLHIEGTLSAGQSCTFYGTYQHAINTVDLVQSQSYIFSEKGKGKVLYYSDTNIANKYSNYLGYSAVVKKS